MKTFITDIFPKLQLYSQKLDSLSMLTNQHWVSINEVADSKTIYIFKSNQELLIATNGKVEKANWEYLGNKSILIDKKSDSYLFKHGFLDENILALKIDSKNEYAVFVNENKFDGELNSMEKVTAFLNNKYDNPDPVVRKRIENTTGHKLIERNNNLSREEQILQDKELNSTSKKLTIVYLVLFVITIILIYWID